MRMIECETQNSAAIDELTKMPKVAATLFAWDCERA